MLAPLLSPAARTATSLTRRAPSRCASVAREGSRPRAIETVVRNGGHVAVLNHSGPQGRAKADHSFSTMGHAAPLEQVAARCRAIHDGSNACMSDIAAIADGGLGRRCDVASRYVDRDKHEHETHMQPATRTAPTDQRKVVIRVETHGRSATRRSSRRRRRRGCVSPTMPRSRSPAGAKTIAPTDGARPRRAPVGHREGRWSCRETVGRRTASGSTIGAREGGIDSA